MTKGSFDVFCQSSFWDSNLTWYTNNPDFTRCFQNTVLVWVPCSLLWLNFLIELKNILTRKQNTQAWLNIQVAKLVILIGLAFISAINFMNEVFDHSPRFDELQAKGILFVTYILAMVLQFHGRKQLSFLQFLFWFSSVVAETVSFRSNLMHIDAKEDGFFMKLILRAVHYTLVLLMFLLSFAGHGRESHHDIPEETASVLSRILYSWMTRFIWNGRKKTMKAADIYPLTSNNRTLEISRQFERYWSYQKPFRSSKTSIVSEDSLNESILKETATTKTKSVGMALMKMVFRTAIVVVATQMLSDIISFTSPAILSWIIEFATNDEPLWRGVLYACLITLVGLIPCLLSEVSTFYSIKAGIRLKTAAIYALYKKTLRLSQIERNNITLGKIYNTMNLDTEYLGSLEIRLAINTLISTPLQLVFAFFFLFKELGIVTAISSFFSMSAATLCGYFIIRKMTDILIRFKRLSDRRIKLTNEIITYVRVLKFYAWEASFQKTINEIRVEEVRLIRIRSNLMATLFTSWILTPLLLTVAPICIYIAIDENNVLTTTKAFVIIQAMGMISLNVNRIPYLMKSFMDFKVSLTRINCILNGGETEDYIIKSSKEKQFAVEISNGSFGWSRDEQLVLRNINLQIPRGSLVAIIGPVGAGKSSLLSSLVCETEKFCGDVFVSGTIGYLTQQAWIQNASVRDNILFLDEMDEIRYWEVIESCALEFDLRILPAYDETEIGERGINLSGGQKQRVSLARAIYREEDIYLLDDPLGAVDSHVAKHLFNKVIGPNGLLKDKTRILVTHNLTFLQYVDQIIFMSNGEIVEKGTYDEILSREGMVRNYFAEHMKVDNPIENTNGKSTENAGAMELCENDLKTDEFVKYEEARGLSGKLMTTENVDEGTTALPVYRNYMKNAGIVLAIFSLISCIVSQTLNVYLSYWLSLWSKNSEHESKIDKAENQYRLVGYIVIGIVYALIGTLSLFCIFFGGVNASKAFHIKMMTSVLRSPMSFFDTTPVGRILNRFSKDFYVLDMQLPTTFRQVLFNGFSSICFLVGTVIKVPLMGIPTFAVAILFTIMQRLLMATNRQLKRTKLTRDSFMFAHLSGVLAGTSIIKACGAEERFASQFRKLVDACNAANYLTDITQRWLYIRYNLSGVFLLFCTSMLCILRKGNISPGIVGFTMTNINMFIQNGGFFITSITNLETSMVSAERVNEYCKLKPEEAKHKLEADLPTTWPQRGRITFNHYSTRYREELDLVLTDITFDIEGGEKIGVVGRTGAGKSSLTLALFRLIEADSGEIVIDGVDISRISLGDLRSRLTIIPQDPVLFSGTLRLNLDPFHKHDDQELWSVLELLHLKPFVKSLQKGLEHPVDDSGQNLSVGQRQLLCLARALLRNTKILILDEATASVDLDTDDLIQATIRKEFANSTVITIAHRINTIMDYDKVMVLDKGRLVEFAPPKTLLDNDQSLFYDLAKNANMI